ncbi:hypothetical protein PFICI_11833 [Pestalotiopsis fici W106-1]|uniref:Uncharacterized protein n=1 Tax=Pestalotiopsis fici (strain W106-1 / CGMCC3.15140) TaxID=1229662 RepID=W3WUB2_PESFW|nr:uncharacterized protein PFICI_11833 [Pestalotiopsis fici W106-1]ETS76446.1 hypothetical protein PFICI_11833 [Pestalotiopsis fici W106-1]
MASKRKAVESPEGEQKRHIPPQPPEPCPFLIQVPTIIDVDVRGDRILVVGTNQCKIMADGTHEHKEAKSFRICSRALARSSPVMRAMLFGKFTAATQDTINFPEDDTAAMEMLLQLSHGNLTPVYDFTLKHDVSQPDPIFVDEVYEMVALANRYLMSHHLRTWARDWASILLKGNRFFPSCPHAVRYKKMEKSLFIASVFGHLQLYAVVFSDLVWSQRRDQKLFATSIEPDGVADSLRKVRLHQIKGILDPIHEAIGSFLGENDSSLYACNQDTQHLQSQCKAYTLGALMRDLNKESLWPLPNPESVHEATGYFCAKIKRSLWSDYTQIHPDCPIPQALVKQMRPFTPRLNDTQEYPWPPRSIVDSLLLRAEEFGLRPTYPEWFVTEGSELKYNCSIRSVSQDNTISWSVTKLPREMRW